MTGVPSFYLCMATECDRPIPASHVIKFCCAPCAAAERGAYELDAHSEACDVRRVERQHVVDDWETRTNLVDMPF